MAVYDADGNIICGREYPTYTDGECTTAFLSYMAKKCTKLGMNGTHYDNPSGLTDQSYSTPQDALKLGISATASQKALDIWSMKDTTFSIGGDNARSLSVTNNVVSTYATTLSNGGYKFLGGKGGSLSSYGYYRAVILLVDIQGIPVIVSLMSTGQTAYNNLDKSAKELCDMVKAKMNGQTPSAGTNISALVSAGGGYSACLVPNGVGGYVNQASPSDLLSRTNSVYDAQTVSLYPASTTKTMTMLCALDYAVNLHEEITVKTSDISTGSGSTFYDGDKLTLLDALCIMMMESSNTLANTIARVIGYKILVGE